jgi:hypothetical protein
MSLRSRKKKRIKNQPWKKAGLLVLLALAFVFSCGFGSGPLKIEVKPEKKDFIDRKPKELPFYVYSAAVYPFPNNFAPSGYMGDVEDMKMTGCYEVTFLADVPSLKVTYEPLGEQGWSGVMWQNPANNWGEFDGGYDLSGVTQLTFFARGDRGGEVVEFKVGGVSSTFSDTVNLTSGDVVLKNKWVKYVFHLEGASLDLVSGGFCFVVTKEENPNGCIFYLDQVRYEK